MAATLAAMGKTVRLRLLALLMTVDEPLCVCELSCGLGLPEYETSRHLTALRRAGLVACSHQGFWTYYRLGDSPLAGALRGMLQASAEILARLQSKQQQGVAGRRVVGPAMSGAGERR